MSFPQVSLLVLSAFNFTQFFWSIFGIFRPSEGKSFLGYIALRLISPLVWFTSLWFICRNELALTNCFLGISAQTFSFVLFWWTVREVKPKTLTVVFSKDTPKSFLNRGPYRWVRHPFYTSYICSYFGVALATQNVYVAGSALMAIVMYLMAASGEENKFMNSDFAGEYSKYKATTGAFWPKISYRKTS